MINRNAYVYIALKGYGYCEAVRSVFGLIVSYTAVLMFVNVLSEIMVFLGKALITAACGWFAYAILDNYGPFQVCFRPWLRAAAGSRFTHFAHPPRHRLQTGGAQQISSSWLVILVTMFFSYAIASAFLSVFDLAVDSVLICYVTDIEENVKRGGARVPAHVRADKFAFKAAKLGNEEEKVRACVLRGGAACSYAYTVSGTVSRVFNKPHWCRSAQAQRLAEPQESYACCGRRPGPAPQGAQPAANYPPQGAPPQIAGANPMRPGQAPTQSYYA